MRETWYPGRWPEQRYDAGLVERCRLAELNARPPKAPAGSLEVTKAPPVEKGSPDTSRPERPHVESVERAAWPISAAVESGEAVFKPGPNWSKRGIAQGFLRWILANGEVAATEIFRRGRQAGISAKALRKAKKVCGIRPVQRRRAWWWSMPPPRRVR
jgi:hypothetical protein